MQPHVFEAIEEPRDGSMQYLLTLAKCGIVAETRVVETQNSKLVTAIASAITRSITTIMIHSSSSSSIIIILATSATTLIVSFS